MPEANSPSSPARVVSRRALVGGAAGSGIALLLGSCSRLSPYAPGSGGGTPGSLPADEAPLIPYADLAAQLAGAADDFAAVAAAPRVASSTGAWALAAAAMCLAQSQPLLRADPLSARAGSMTSPHGVDSASPSPSRPPGLSSRLAAIAARQRLLVAQFRARCLEAATGDLALLLGSLAVSAHAVRGPAVPVAPSDLAPAHLDVGSREDALRVLLSRVDALAQGLEVGVGALPGGSAEVDDGEKRLGEVWALRDDIETRLVRASATPTPGPLAYQLPGTTGSATAVRTLWGRLERDVMAAWLRVAAASTGDDRGRAVDAAMAQQDLAASLATPISWWPGWV